MNNFITPDRGLIGLKNVGNSCFLNSVVQCLAKTEGLLEYFVQSRMIDGKQVKNYQIHLNTQKKTTNKNKQNKTKTKKELVEIWVSLLKQLWSKNDPNINPVPFYRKIGEVASESNLAIGINGGQNDFQEFLITLLDSMHDALSYEPTMTITKKSNDLSEMDMKVERAYQNFIDTFRDDYSIIVSLFTGQIYTITMGECGHKSEVFNPIKFIPVVVPESKSPVRLEDLLQDYISESLLGYDTSQTGIKQNNMWECEVCTKHKREDAKSRGMPDDKVEKISARVLAKTKTTIWNLPQYLIISLGRYQYFPNLKKIETNVIYPIEELDMTPFYSGLKNTKSFNNTIYKSLKYRLYAISVHLGNPSGGHYYAMARNSASGKWYNFNDSHVSEADMNNVQNQGAYCLFYERINK